MIHELVTSHEYRHVPTGTLAVRAQRLGQVFASASTWYRLIRDHQWRRTRQRIHPAKPKIGIRASRPNEIWHILATLIRLLDGSRAYLHAVIDNFSRRILAWKVTPSFEPDATAEILLAASKGVDHGVPTVLTDGGVENFNGAVDELIHSGLLHRAWGRHGNHVFQFPDRILVAGTQTPMAVPEHTGHCQKRREAGGVLRGGTQFTTAALGITWANAG